MSTDLQSLPEQAKTSTLGVSQQTAQKLRVVAAHRQVTLIEAFDRYGGPGIDREYRKVLGEMQAELGGEGG